MQARSTHKTIWAQLFSNHCQKEQLHNLENLNIGKTNLKGLNNKIGYR